MQGLSVLINIPCLGGNDGQMAAWNDTEDSRCVLFGRCNLDRFYTPRTRIVLILIVGLAMVVLSTAGVLGSTYVLKNYRDKLSSQQDHLLAAFFVVIFSGLSACIATSIWCSVSIVRSYRQREYLQ